MPPWCPSWRRTSWRRTCSPWCWSTLSTGTPARSWCVGAGGEGTLGEGDGASWCGAGSREGKGLLEREGGSLAGGSPLEGAGSLGEGTGCLSDGEGRCRGQAGVGKGPGRGRVWGGCVGLALICWAQALLRGLNLGSQKHAVPSLAVALALEGKASHRELTSRLLSDLVGRVVSPEDIAWAFDKMLQDLPDLILDTPEAPQVSVGAGTRPCQGCRGEVAVLGGGGSARGCRGERGHAGNARVSGGPRADTVPPDAGAVHRPGGGRPRAAPGLPGALQGARGLRARQVSAAPAPAARPAPGPHPVLRRAALDRAAVLLRIKRDVNRLDNVWGVGGGQRPVKHLVKEVSARPAPRASRAASLGPAHALSLWMSPCFVPSALPMPPDVPCVSPAAPLWTCTPPWHPLLVSPRLLCHTSSTPSCLSATPTSGPRSQPSPHKAPAVSPLSPPQPSLSPDEPAAAGVPALRGGVGG